MKKWHIVLGIAQLGLSSFLIWQINQFYVIARAQNVILGGTHACAFDSFAYIKFNTVIERLNQGMIKKMDFSLFDTEKYPELIENIKKNIPQLSDNPDFLKALEDHTFNDFIKTLDHDTQYAIFKEYSDFIKNTSDLPLSPKDIEKFNKGFEALQKLHDSGYKTNYLIFCNFLIGLAIFLPVFAINNLLKGFEIVDISEICMKKLQELNQSLKG